MFYILYGQDSFSLNQAVEKIKAGLGDRELVATNTTSLEGKNLTLSELRNKCGAAPFLSSYRLVIVDGLLGRFEAKQGRPRSGRGKSRNGLGEWEGLASYVGKMPETTVLMLIDRDVKGNNPLLKKLSPLAEVRTFPLLRGRDLKVWIQQRVKEEGGDITSPAVKLLAELIGGDLWAMNGEIQKLILYGQNCPISEDDVKQLVSYAQEANIFALVDAVAEGHTELAQQILHRLYDDGMQPTHILAMITRQFRLIALTLDLPRRLSRPQIQERLGLKSSYPLDKTLSQAKLYDFEGVKRVYDKLLETDSAIKTGKYSDKLALELLVTELACLKLTA
ncbi:MAG: DNA polymerase III subunit delta [Dehalococcoidia bacterium]|nr:DNA polymerase III subunit delta [Dehalococcoidia bacterium]RLC65248.1 MAG: DNA polymerase III subunit delta [Chloroflexota bacterium]